MQLNLESSSAKYQIKKQASGCITVNDQDFAQSILIMPNYLNTWRVKSIKELQAQNLADLLDLKPELILLGTGNNLEFIDVALSQTITKQKIGLEIMTTAAACRTYTILIAEGRNVLAALIV